MFLAFFNKKQRYRLKLDDSVARKKAGGRRREDNLEWTIGRNLAQMGGSQTILTELGFGWF